MLSTLDEHCQSYSEAAVFGHGTLPSLICVQIPFLLLWWIMPPVGVCEHTLSVLHVSGGVFVYGR